MTGKVLSVAHHGLRCQIVEVEADVSRHLPSFVLVGLPDTAIQEARERIRSAMENSNLPFPRSKLTVNLAPAHLRKEGSVYDCAIAISILRAQEELRLCDEDQNAVFLGELSLSGRLRPVKGALLAAAFLKKAGFQRLYVSEQNAQEASYIEGLEVYAIASLNQLVDHLTHVRALAACGSRVLPPSFVNQSAHDFSEVRGQQQAKRALEIAAAGGHNVLLNGVPGSGKTMLAKSFMSILPSLSRSEMLEVSQIYSYAGLLPPDTALIQERQFRSPHHTASVASIVGGGTWPKPGEITLAHRGVLFLDEFPEFPRNVLEALRQPLEDRVVSISRAAGSLRFPAHFILLAAQNPCPCGAWGDREKICTCTPQQRQRYQRRVSGPLLDRIDLHVRVQPVGREQLLGSIMQENSANVLKRVRAARERQRARFSNEVTLNADMDQVAMKRFCKLDTSSTSTLMSAATKLHLSARAFYKVIKISRTVADLGGRKNISEEDILEALQYRSANEEL